MAEASSFVVDRTTVLSLFSTVAILGAAYAASLALLPKNASTKIRALFVWHAFDALIHFLLEGSYLYNCFFTYTTLPELLSKNPSLSTSAAVSQYLPPNIYFLGLKDRVYGPEYGNNPFAALWMEVRSTSSY